MMILQSFLPYIQIILSLALIAGILLQQSEASLGSAFGGDSFSSVQHTRRGFEKIIFRVTIVIAVLFAASAFLALIIR
ncbi:MAG: preprotein translocase subunit SecG [Candidatus Pacebacteria bacterium]|nr:preprotein translocase subunit SecG [Candidatus Paceibacterota bacterium]